MPIADYRLWINWKKKAQARIRGQGGGRVHVQARRVEQISTSRPKSQKAVNPAKGPTDILSPGIRSHSVCFQLEKARQKVGEQHAFRWRAFRVVGVVEQHQHLRIELAQKLPATSTRNSIPCQGHADGGKLTNPHRHRTTDCRSLRTDCQSIRGVFHIAARNDLTRSGQ